jgi:hypothetical protein
MSPDARRALVRSVRGIVDELEPADALELLDILRGAPGNAVETLFWPHPLSNPKSLFSGVKARMVAEITRFFRGELNMLISPAA